MDHSRDVYVDLWGMTNNYSMVYERLSGTARPQP